LLFLASVSTSNFNAFLVALYSFVFSLFFHFHLFLVLVWFVPVFLLYVIINLIICIYLLLISPFSSFATSSRIQGSLRDHLSASSILITYYVKTLFILYIFYSWIIVIYLYIPLFCISVLIEMVCFEKRRDGGMLPRVKTIIYNSIQNSL